jgi:hypothetical protein
LVPVKPCEKIWMNKRLFSSVFCRIFLWLALGIESAPKHGMVAGHTNKGMGLRSSMSGAAMVQLGTVA